MGGDVPASGVPRRRRAPGVKVRRGLGTGDSEEADALVAELNALLGDESYWNVAERRRAEQRFHHVVVRAFYEPMENPAGKDPMAIRDEEMPLPGKDEGYSRVMLIGTTGAGKTSLLRQLIGSHPTRDRFPSTSTGKTTIADIEVIAGPGDFEAVVTFFPRRLVQTYVAESVLEACKTAWRDGSDERVMRDLLNHRDQRFRLGYLLGAWSPDERESEEDDWGDGAEDEEPGRSWTRVRCRPRRNVRRCSPPWRSTWEGSGHSQRKRTRP